MKLFINAFKQGIARVFTLPRLSLPLVSTLGLTLAAVLTVVAVANTILFQPLPDVKEHELYQIDLQLTISEGLNVPFFSDPRRVAAIKKVYGDELAWGYIHPMQTAIKVGSKEISVSQFRATTGSPKVLGLDLLMGQSSDIDNAEEGVWISKSLWNSAFNNTTQLSALTLRLEGNEYPVFGVFDDFTSLSNSSIDAQSSAQVWRMSNLSKTLESQDAISLNMGPIAFVRGPSDIIPQPSELEQWYVDYVNREITDEQAREFLLSKEKQGQVISYRDAFIGDSQKLVFVLMFAMFSLLIMACLNLLNMFIAHYQSRSKEFAIQICMGASIGKLRSLIFIENLPMFLMATVLGLIAAGWLIELLPTLVGGNLPMLDQISLDLTSIFVALAVILFINLVFVIIALIYVDKTALTESLNSSGKGTPAQQKQTVSKALMIIQLTLACVLLTSASVSVKDSYSGVYTDLGYRMLNAYEVSMNISDETWQQSLGDFEHYRGSEWQQLRSKMAERLSALGGTVVDVIALPLTSSVSMIAYPDPETGDSVMIRPMMWAPGLLTVFDIEVLAGRDLIADDIDLPHVLVSKPFAIGRAGEGDWRSIVGSEIKMGEELEDIYTVIGVVEDVIPLPSGAMDLDAPEVYFSSSSTILDNRLTMVVVMDEGAELQQQQVEQALKGIDARLGEVQLESMQQRWDGLTQATRLNMYVVLGLAILTMVLAAIGVSGLSQMSASQKRYELAVRMATGAKQSQLLKLLVSDSVWMLLIGLGLGVVAAVGAYHYLVGFFDSVPAFDWFVTMAINTLLAVVMLLSVSIPGWLVIRKDPMRVLREL